MTLLVHLQSLSFDDVPPQLVYQLRPPGAFSPLLLLDIGLHFPQFSFSERLIDAFYPLHSAALKEGIARWLGGSLLRTVETISQSFDFRVQAWNNNYESNY